MPLDQNDFTLADDFIGGDDEDGIAKVDPIRSAAAKKGWVTRKAKGGMKGGGLTDEQKARLAHLKWKRDVPNPTNRQSVEWRRKENQQLTTGQRKQKAAAELQRRRQFRDKYGSEAVTGVARRLRDGGPGGPLGDDVTARSVQRRSKSVPRRGDGRSSREVVQAARKRRKGRGY